MSERETQADRRDRRDRALPRFSLDRPVTVVVLLAAFLVVGFVATRLIPLELLPQGWNAPHLSINTPWQDAPPQEVVDKIILPIEEEVSSVRGIERVSSYARSGYGGVYLSFKQDTDMDVAYREVRDRVQRARLRMPDDVEQVFIRKEDPSGLPIFMVGVTLDPELTDVYNLIEYQIKRPIERIDGVASVMIEGLQEKEILIELDREATEAAGLSIYDLGRELSGDNFTLASGHVRTGGSKLLLRSVARYESLEALENRPVGPDLRLSDIATVTYAEPERRWMVRANSRPAYALMIMKEGQANTIEVAERVRALVDDFQDDPRLGSVDVKIFFDQGDAIMESLGTLLDSGKIGAYFAIAVLFFFLRRVRMTLIITLSIPLSILLALAVMFFVGETLNMFTLLGLMISVGLLVDNSVVVAENIFRVHREGASRREACIRGAGEMALAITMATLTTVAVFLPVSLVEGGGQFFLRRLSIPISVSLLASLLVALVVIPLAVYVTLPSRREVESEAETAGWKRAWNRLHDRSNHALRGAYEATFGRLNRSYGRLLDACLRRRLDLVLLTLAVFAGSCALFQTEQVKIVPMQEDEAMAFELDVDLPRGTTYEEVQEYFLQAEEVIAGMQEELGLDGYLVVCGRWGGGEIQGWFRSPRTVDVTPREAAEKVRDALPERAGVTFYLGDENRGGEEAADKTHTVVLTGEDPGQLEETAKGLEELFRSVPGVLGTKRSEEAAPDELALVVDRDRAQRQGVSPEVVAGVVGYALRGEALPRYSQDGREIPVRVRFEEEDRQSLAQLADFAVPVGDPMAGAGAGDHGRTSVSLSSLTDVQLLDAPRSIHRRDKRTSRSITLELEEGDEEEARERLIALAEGIDLPEGISFGEPVRRQGMDDDAKGLLFAAALSIVFIYLLMGFLFESFMLPLSILFTIPLATIGVAVIHWVTGKSLDVLGMVGAVLLIGVVVNNGIVLVDYVNRLRDEGKSRHDAILLASERRFRPIMMTALTTICGMVPLTLGGATSIGLSYTSFGLTLIGGMTSATLLTLLVVPVFYTLFEDLRDAVTQAAARGLARRKARDTHEPGPRPELAG